MSDADRNEEEQNNQEIEDWLREEQAQKLKNKEYKDNFNARHPGRSSEYQAKWRENKKIKMEQ